MQIFKLADLEPTLRLFLDPDGTGILDDEINTLKELIPDVVAQHSPRSTELCWWDQENGDDPPLDLERYQNTEVLPMTYNSGGQEYYGMSVYHTDFSGQPVISIYIGGSVLQSAPGFYLIPVQPVWDPSAQG